MRGGFSKCFFVVVLFFQVLQVRLVLVKPNSCLDCEQPHNHLFIIIYLFIESSRSKAHVRDKWRSREERGQNSTKREKITETPGGGGGGDKGKGDKAKGVMDIFWNCTLQLYVHQVQILNVPLDGC